MSRMADANTFPSVLVLFFHPRLGYSWEEFSLTHFALVAGVFLGGLEEVAAAAQVFVVLVQRHVSVLNQHVWQVRLCSDRAER